MTQTYQLQARGTAEGVAEDVQACMNSRKRQTHLLGQCRKRRLIFFFIFLLEEGKKNACGRAIKRRVHLCRVEQGGR